MRKHDTLTDLSGGQDPSTKEKLLDAGKDAFYEKGYLGASLRQICSACGVTTGAFYFFFPSKEALFCAIVDPVIDACIKTGDSLVTSEINAPETGRENDLQMMEFEYRYRKEILILTEGAKGSCREHFRESILEHLEKSFRRFFAASLGREPNPDIIRILVQFRYESNISILKGAKDMEQALFLAEILACYADSGFQSLMEQYKDVL